MWFKNFANAALSPSNVTTNLDSYFVDSLLSINLTQINGIFDKLNQILDLIFVSDDNNYCASQCNSLVSDTGVHHIFFRY